MPTSNYKVRWNVVIEKILYSAKILRDLKPMIDQWFFRAIKILSLFIRWCEPLTYLQSSEGKDETEQWLLYPSTDPDSKKVPGNRVDMSLITERQTISCYKFQFCMELY